MRSALLRATAALAVATAAILTAAPLGAQQPVAADRFAGTWQGTLNTGVSTLRLGLAITRTPAGAVTGELTSIDQGNGKIPAVVSTSGDTLVFDVAQLQVHYVGVLAGDSLRGTFRQGPGTLPLAFGRVAALAAGKAPARPQNPKPPFPYRTENVTVQSVPGVTLAGTLTLPAGAGPFPAAVFVTGSGPQDRDEMLLGHRPFLVIADYLARHGIASLRYDDRGTAMSTGNFRQGTTADFADDAQAALHFLGARPEIAKKQVGIIGHSEGGLIAPMVAARDRDVAFIVMLAGPGLPGDSILVLQQRAIMMANGMPASQAAQAAASNGLLFAAIRGAKDSADADARARAAFRRLTDSLPADQRAAAQKAFDVGVPQLLSPWMRSFLEYDPRPTLRRVTVPVLALNGALDMQVPATADLAEIDAALKAAGNRDYRVMALPGLNHLFQTATTGSPGEYEKIEETIAPSVLELITTWITQHTTSR